MTLEDIKKLDPLPEVKLLGEDGNAWSIMGSCKKAAKGFYTDKEWELIQKKMMSGDYDHLLQIAMEYFDVT